MPLLFVYGTLMRGEVAHARLGGARFVDVHTTAPRYSLVEIGWYPGAREGGAQAVVGELYDITAAVLEELDRYEGDAYVRTTIATPHGPAILFVYRGLEGTVIESGDWRRR